MNHSPLRFKPILLLLIPAIVLGFHAAYYYPFLSDDSLISLRYSLRLLQGKGLTWNDDMAVEGYSNLSLVLLASLLGKAGMDLITAVRVIGIGSFIGVFFISFCLWKNDRHIQPSTLFLTQLLYAFCAPVAIWSIGGLEQPLVSLFLGSAIFFLYQFIQHHKSGMLLAASLCLGLLCITRPDSPLFCASLAFSLYWQNGFDIRQTLKQVLLLAIFPVIFVVVQTGFRLHYYGDWIPNTAYIKLSPSIFSSMSGLLYTINAIFSLSPWLMLILAQLFTNRSLLVHPLLKLVLPSAFFWFVYVVFIGGDIFPGLRHFVVIITLFFLITPLIFSEWLKEKTYFKQAMLITGTIAFITLQFTSTSSRAGKNERWEWEGKIIADTLQTAFANTQPLIAVSAAGSLPYFTEFPSIDMLGLNDYHVARHPTIVFTTTWTGHGYGNSESVIQRNPDIIVFCGATGSAIPCWPAEQQLSRLPQFMHDFTLVKILAFTHHQAYGQLWFNKYSEKVGIKQLKNTLLIPGYLFTGNEKSYSILNSDKQLCVVINKDQPAIFNNLTIQHPVKTIAIKSSSNNLDYEFINTTSETFTLIIKVKNTIDDSNILLESVTIN